jgi:peroxiredoxin Q/BCP
MTIEPGAVAPSFELTTDAGERVRLEDFAGRRLVLYFYPRDDTPGCTKEAISFTEHLEAFHAANAEVIGISKDTVEKHAKFKAKHDLRVRLAADPAGEVVQQYGVWVEKSMYGRTSMGIERSTFLIDEAGIVRQVWRKVRVPGHVEKVLEAVQGLG